MKTENKHGIFKIHAETGEVLTVIPRTISRSVLDRVRDIDARIVPLDKRAENVHVLALQLQKNIEKQYDLEEEDRLTFEQICTDVLHIKREAIPLFKLIVERRATLDEIRNSLDKGVISRTTDIARIEIIQLVADRTAMSSADLSLLDCPAAPLPASADGKKKPSKKKATDVPEVTTPPAYNFWDVADIIEVRNCADYFRGLLTQ